MRKLFKTFALLLVGLLALFVLVGCGGDEDVENEKMPVSFVSATPPSGSCPAANASITLTFDGEPEEVRVNPGVAFTSGKTVTVSGPFTPGPLTLSVTWADGTHTLTYGLGCWVDVYLPEVTGGTVEDSDKNVNPEVINSEGKIEISFSEEVTGNIALQTEAGDDVGWLGKVHGNKATLELVKGRMIGNETTYVIVGKVSDATGNEAEVKITFVTKSKE